MVDRVDHLFDTVVEAHYVRDKETNTSQWLIVFDWLRVRVSYIRIIRSDSQQLCRISGNPPPSTSHGTVYCCIGLSLQRLMCRVKLNNWEDLNKIEVTPVPPYVARNAKEASQSSLFFCVRYRDVRWTVVVSTARVFVPCGGLKYTIVRGKVHVGYGAAILRFFWR